MRVSKRQRARDYVAEHGWSRIGEAEWAELRAALPDVSETTLRECGVPIDSPWRGIHQHTLDELEASLVEFSEVYEHRPDLHTACRAQVIAAKDRARWLSRSPRIDAEKRQLKTEMTDWLLVWLDDPAIFPVWVRARRAQLDRE
jgi:hypothetical protein